MTLHKRPIGAVVAGIVLVGIGWFDYHTGSDIGLSLLYLIPVAITGWYVGVSGAVIVGAAASIVWLLADVLWPGSDMEVAITTWNTFTRFVIYVSQGVLLALLRRDREKLHKLAAAESALARTDVGTSLPNARAFLEIVEAEMIRARETGDPVCVVYVDLDNFKVINDRYGHAAGDEVLQRVATALQRSIRGHDVAARLGGDEFAVLLRGIEPEPARNVGERIAMRVREIGANYSGTGLGATVGVAHFRAVPDSADALLRAADVAMYTGKASSKGSVIVQHL